MRRVSVRVWMDVSACAWQFVIVENFALPLTVEDPQLHKCYYHHHHYCTVTVQPVFISAAHQTSLNHTSETGPTTTS